MLRASIKQKRHAFSLALVFYFFANFLKLQIACVRIIYRISGNAVNEVYSSCDACEVTRATPLYNIMLALSGELGACIGAVRIAPFVLRLEVVSSPEAATLSFVCSNKKFSPFLQVITVVATVFVDIRIPTSCKIPGHGHRIIGTQFCRAARIGGV